MSDLEEEPTEERRVPVDEQPLALAVAEEAGTLPEDDRRKTAMIPDANFEAAPVVEEVSAAVPDATGCPTCAALDKAGIGTALDKQAHGWKLKLVDGGTVVLTEGRTITEALFGIVSVEAPVAPASEEVAPVAPVVIPEPVLKRGDGTPMQDVGGQLVVAE